MIDYQPEYLDILESTQVQFGKSLYCYRIISTPMSVTDPDFIESREMVLLCPVCDYDDVARLSFRRFIVWKCNVCDNVFNYLFLGQLLEPATR